MMLLLWTEQVSKAYSKTWSYREDAQLAVYRHLLDATGHDREEMRSTLRAAVFLVQRGIDDKVYAVSGMVSNVAIFL